MSDYKLSFTAEEIDELLRKVANGDSGVYVLKEGEELSDAPAGVNLVISLSDTLIDAEGVGF